jgi:hypothetical protein
VAACGGQSMSATSAIAPAALWASAINSLFAAAAVSRNWIEGYVRICGGTGPPSPTLEPKISNDVACVALDGLRLL